MKVGLNIVAAWKKRSKAGPVPGQSDWTVHEGCTSCNLRRSTGRQAPSKEVGILESFNDSRSQLKSIQVLRTLTLKHYFIVHFRTYYVATWGIGIWRPPADTPREPAVSPASTSKSWRYCRKMIRCVSTQFPGCFDPLQVCHFLRSNNLDLSLAG